MCNINTNQGPPLFSDLYQSSPHLLPSPSLARCMASMPAECNLEITSENTERAGMSEIDGTLLMELLDDSSYIEPEVDEDDRLGRVIQSLQAEISSVDMVTSVDDPLDDCGLMDEMVMSDIDGVVEYRSDWVETSHIAAEFMEECSPLYFYGGGEVPMEQEHSPLWD